MHTCKSHVVIMIIVEVFLLEVTKLEVVCFDMRKPEGVEQT